MVISDKVKGYSIKQRPCSVRGIRCFSKVVLNNCKENQPREKGSRGVPNQPALPFNNEWYSWVPSDVKAGQKLGEATGHF